LVILVTLIYRNASSGQPLGLALLKRGTGHRRTSLDLDHVRGNWKITGSGTGAVPIPANRPRGSPTPSCDFRAPQRWHRSKTISAGLQRVNARRSATTKRTFRCRKPPQFAIVDRLVERGFVSTRSGASFSDGVGQRIHHCVSGGRGGPANRARTLRTRAC